MYIQVKGTIACRGCVFAKFNKADKCPKIDGKIPCIINRTIWIKKKDTMTIKHTELITNAYTILDFQNSADNFNIISGGANKISKWDILNQIQLIQEEVQETVDGFNAEDLTAVLDGCIDTLYTALGLLQKLKELGIDTQGAMKQVADDNLSKFPVTLKEVTETIEMYTDKEVAVTLLYNSAFDVHVIKDMNDKVKKPKNFVSTDLNKYVPYGVLNK